MPLTAEQLVQNVDTAALIAKPLSDWRSVLAEECQVYVFGETYLAKRFDQINYKFCEKNEAKEILVDNLYALLRYKYFPKVSEEIDERIQKIVSSFTANLKTTLKKVSFDESSDAEIVNMIPNYCIAFRNGVFNFKDNKWFFKYDVVKLKNISNTLYSYDNKYIIQWYLDYDFNSLNIDIMDVKLKDFIEVMKETTKVNQNYCFELMYNISHNEYDEFDFDRFNHLCEILGYTMLQSFSQYFIMLIGAGQNGKNSLFDGCFTNRIIPRPASNDLDAIENDRFITGSLENKSHNIFLEASPKTYTESKMLKALTGSMYQTIESKGVSKYSGVINCKYIWAANDQDRVKFSDTTNGFRRRINMFEIYYTWDESKRFMKRGDYYDTTFSDELTEIKRDPMNTTVFVYFAMYGILSATNNFTQTFRFTSNDWSDKYSDIDLELRDAIESFTLDKLTDYIDSGKSDVKTMLFDENKIMLKDSPTIKELGYNGFNDLVKMLKDDEASTAYFADHDIYIAVRSLQSALKDFSSPTSFTQSIKKIYRLGPLDTLYGNKPYVKCTFAGKRFKVLK